MTDIRQTIYKAALLHDIGKFWQRAEPVKGKHQVLSMKYVAERLGDEKIAQLTRYHHQADLDGAIKKGEINGQDALFAQIVCLADSMASMERTWFQKIEDEEGKRRMSLEQRTAWSLRAQESIFNKVHLKLPTSFQDTWYQPICNLTPDWYKWVLSDKSYQTRPLIKEGYQKFWNEFQEEFEKELAPEGNKNLTTIFYLLKKYLWCIPSSYWLNHPDISLFEHSRLTAAIALCMYDFLQEEVNGDWQKTNPAAIKEGTQNQYLLLVADLSGIQGFLYNIAHSGALRALKGRSYFLQHLMDATARQVLKRLDLYEANLLYSSGGKFYILLPNTEKARQVVSQVEKEANAHLLKTYHGELAVIFAAKSLAKHDFKPGEISERWKELNEDLERNKLRRFADNIDKDFFKPDEIAFGNVQLCYATTTELEERSVFEKEKEPLKAKGLFYNMVEDQGKRFFEITDENEETGQRDPTGYWIQEEQYESQILGQKLKKEPKASAILEKGSGHLAKLDQPSGLWDWEQFELVAEENYQLDFPPGTEKAFLFNDDDFMALAPEAKGWKFYAGNWHPENTKGEAADFSDLAAATTGLKRLAVLRMDVDNLGKIFREGINDGQLREDGKRRSIAPFSRIVQLSNLLDFFFSGYLNKLHSLYWSPAEGVHSDASLPKAEKLRDALQIIYAGGDDLCIVGKWNVIPDVALWIQEQFVQFTGGNPSVTLSAGIALFGEKYPLFKVAEIAGEAEGRAKKHSGKNAVCFLDHVTTWDNFRRISRYARGFYAWIEEGLPHPESGKKEKLPSSFLHIIQELYSEFSGATPMRRLTQDKIENNRYGRWRWLGAYRLHRFGAYNKAYQEEMQKLAFELFTNKDTSAETDFLLILYTASQWADFLTRKND